jgi:histidinol dehydrogenase
VRIERLTLTGADEAPACASRIRVLVPMRTAVEEAVAGIVEQVRTEGDAAVIEFTHRFDTAARPPRPMRVDPTDLRAALEQADPALRSALELARANVERTARVGLGAEAEEVELAQGQRIVIRELPVRRAGLYVPGGRAPYPSTVVMAATTARVAGVEEVLVCSPPGPDGDLHPATLAACALCEADAVFRVGGAQAIAALAYGTQTVPRVDVVAGPGSLYVQEAKRLVSGDVGIDGFQGPSDLVVLLDSSKPEILSWISLDLLAQAEHGAGSVVVAIATDASALGALAELLAAGATDEGGPAALVHAPDLDSALALAEAFAPEHLQLVGPGAEALAGRVRSAGCLFVGAESATAFGDYVAGSNHVLPTAGAARFASTLSPRHFRRRMAEVRIGPAAAALAPAGAALARAEGFETHARSMEARTRAVGENREP